MPGFTKLHSTIINSSIWNESDNVRIVWITMLAMADKTGFVESSMSGLCHQARKTKEQITDALIILESPDPDSKNPDHEGRRLKRVEAGWIVLNYALYRDKADLSDDPEDIATRERVRRYRERKRQERTEALHPVTSVTPASAYASVSDLGGGVGEPTEKEFVSFCTSPIVGILPNEATDLFLKLKQRGWKDGGNVYVEDWRIYAQRMRPYIEQDRAKRKASQPEKPREKKHVY